MFFPIYAIGFFATVLFLVGWFYLQARRKNSTLVPLFLLIALGAYAWGVLGGPGGAEIKLGVVFCDELRMYSSSKSILFFEWRFIV